MFGLNIFDSIQLAVMDIGDEISFAIAQATATSRAAGTNSNTNNSTAVDNKVSKAANTVTCKKEEPVVTKKEEPVVTKKEEPVVMKAESVIKDLAEKAKAKKMAEAKKEEPVVNKDASNKASEKTAKNEVVASDKEVAMTSGKECKNGDIIQFPAFGVSINTNPNRPVQNNQCACGHQHNPALGQQIPMQNQQQNPVVTQGDVERTQVRQAFMSMVNNFNIPNPAYNNMANPAAVPGFGNHKQDNPQQKPVKQKAPADNVTLDMSNMEPIQVEYPVPPQTPDIIVPHLPKAEDVPQEEVWPKFDNSELNATYWYLSKIEAIANSKGIQLQMFKIPFFGREDFTGLIGVNAYNLHSNVVNPFKSFVIDTGVIIDKRIKVLVNSTGHPAFFEDMDFYPMTISPDKNNKNNNGEKKKSVFNEKLFQDLFTGGYQMLDPNRGMFSRDLLQLNKIVALKTVPDKTGNYKEIRNRLIEALRNGVFTSSLNRDPMTRFAFVEYDDKCEEFVLSSANVPAHYGYPDRAVYHTEIAFKANNVIQPPVFLN